jgi:hypothetical protein
MLASIIHIPAYNKGPSHLGCKTLTPPPKCFHGNGRVRRSTCMMLCAEIQ